MVEMTHDKREHDDAAFVDAYERRLAGGRPEDVPAAWREEIEQMVVIHERLAALPLPDVSPAVRSAVLTAAAQAASERPQSLWSKIAEFLMRPGPILATAAALALLVAVGQRESKPAVDAGAVAVSEPLAPPEVAQAAPAPAPNPPAEAQVAQGIAKEGDKPPSPPAAAPPPAVAEPPPAVAKAEAARPTRTIAAQPASIAPDMAANTEPERQAPQQAALAEGIADDQRKLPPAPVMGMARAAENRGQNLEAMNKANQFAQAPRAEAKAEAEPMAVAQDKKTQDVAKDSAEVAKSDVQQLKAAVDKTTDPAKRKALLVKLRAVALQAGDGKTAQWADQALAASNANESSPGGVPNKAKAAPAKSAAPASEKTSY
ncbi:MAG: hypothetical protein HY902_17965 [Deltaproteobacteria bacterium]|nr:hypothetical protein [Deltaproteobacteria bacterium]